MTHHHETTGEGEKDNLHCNCRGKDVGYLAYVLGASILIGAILISASVFYNFKVLIGRLESGTVALTGDAANNPGAQNPAPTQQQAPTGPVNVAERSDAPVLGNKDAKVTIYEFSDFQCPFCQKFFNETFGKIKEKYVDTGKVKIVFRHYPLPFHVNADKAAQASECANLQGKFWQYHDLLFKNGQSDGTNLDTASLKKYADQLGLNSGTLGFAKNKFNQCLDNGNTADIVKKDVADGSAAGVNGTPTLFVDGKPVVGAQPIATFEQAIEEALKK